MPAGELPRGSDRGWEQLYDHACNRLTRTLGDLNSSMTLRFNMAKGPRLIHFSITDSLGKRVGRPLEISTATVLSQRRYTLRNLLLRVMQASFN
jgi:hypothetical protein